MGASVSLQSAGLALWAGSWLSSPPQWCWGLRTAHSSAPYTPAPVAGQGVVPRVVLMLRVLQLSGSLAFSLGTAIVTLEL